MKKNKILFICGTYNQTTMMHKIAQNLGDYDCYFTPYYADGYIDILATKGYLDFTILGSKLREITMNYLWDNQLRVDFYGNSYNYDLVFTCSDLLVPKNVRNKKMILVQEGMTDPKNIMFYIVKWFKIPRYLASSSTTGLSGSYDYFCVASEGYKELFIKNGIDPSKILVTGIPNYDNCIEYKNNDFPHKGFVLVATSDARETYKFENRKKFILDSLDIAGERQLIFKLHPNENFERAIFEINKYAPEGLVYTSGNVHEMIANCDELITKYSTVVYTGIALGKKIHSYFDYDQLQRLTPIQNGGTSAKNISNVAIQLLQSDKRINLVRSDNDSGGIYSSSSIWPGFNSGITEKKNLLKTKILKNRVFSNS
jgi:hypothetical protein